MRRMSQYLDEVQQAIDDVVREDAKAGYLISKAERDHDTTKHLPLKKLDIMPKSQMGGILGMTIIGWDWMALRDDQVYDMNTIVHEMCHTEDEYETRVITMWMLSRERGGYYN